MATEHFEHPSIFLHPLPECWDGRYVPPHPGYVTRRIASTEPHPRFITTVSHILFISRRLTSLNGSDKPDGKDFPSVAPMQSHLTRVIIWEWDFQDGQGQGSAQLFPRAQGPLQIILLLGVGSPTPFARFGVLGNWFPSFLVPSTFSPQGYIIDVLATIDNSDEGHAGRAVSWEP